jgi:hypothetical protein
MHKKVSVTFISDIYTVAIVDGSAVVDAII